MCKSLYFPGCCLGLSASGEHLKLWNGISLKGPAILFSLSSFSSFSVTIWGFCSTDGELLDVNGESGPSNDIEKPKVNPSMMYGAAG